MSAFSPKAVIQNHRFRLSPNVRFRPVADVPEIGGKARLVSRGPESLTVKAAAFLPESGHSIRLPIAAVQSRGFTGAKRQTETRPSSTRLAWGNEPPNDDVEKGPIVDVRRHALEFLTRSPSGQSLVDLLVREVVPLFRGRDDSISVGRRVQCLLYPIQAPSER